MTREGWQLWLHYMCFTLRLTAQKEVCYQRKFSISSFFGSPSLRDSRVPNYVV